MPGFFISNCYTPKVFKDINIYNYQEDEMTVDGYYIKRKVIDRFLGDKAFVNQDEYCVITDGVILNKTELFREYSVSTTDELIIYLYLNKRELLPLELRGSFSGAIYDKKQKYWYMYTNHVGNKPIFYYTDNQNVIISSSPIYIADALREYGISPIINSNSVYNLLSYGFMIGNSTLIEQITRLPYGSYLTIDTDINAKIGRYYNISNLYSNHLTLDETIKKMNELFVAAVKREYDKDDEYGYAHLAQLSGGLDSRYSVWVANKILKHSDMVCYCFSQSNTLDQFISQKIASDLSIEYIFKNLDDATFIFSFDECFLLNYGLCCSSGQFLRYSFDRNINFCRFGLLHTGQLGGTIAGSYVNRTEDIHIINKQSGINSAYMLSKTNNDFSGFDNQEIYMLTQRGFNGILCSDFICDSSSPFLDVDFFDFCMTLPLNIRQKQNGIYKKLLCSRYPELSAYKWEKTNCPLNANKLQTLVGKVIKYGFRESLALGVKKITHKDIIKSHMKKGSSMNPYDEWYSNNAAVKRYMDSYIKNNLDALQIEDTLKSDMRTMYDNVSAREKVQVLSAICAIKNYTVQCDLSYT